VEDSGPEQGSLVLSDAGLISDPDTLFPLQAALGYDVAQNLFIGDKNLIVEGVADFIYLQVMSAFLASQERNGLMEEIRILPAGSGANIVTFIALLGRKLRIAVLVDGSTSRQRLEQAIASGLMKKSGILSTDEFSGIKESDIEDLFSPEEYLDV